MKNFETIRKTCETSSSISKTVIDEFLLYYAAALYKLDRTMTEAFSAYRHVTNEFEKEWVNRLKAQYLAHQIFKSGGLIRKMLPHTALTVPAGKALAQLWLTRVSNRMTSFFSQPSLTEELKRKKTLSKTSKRIPCPI